MDRITILIADDHKLIREIWGFILNRDLRFEVVASVGDAAEAVELARIIRPEIVLMDINLPPFSGLEATKRIRKISPASRIIGISMYSLPVYAKKMLLQGASGYVTKNSSWVEMTEAITTVSQGNKYICSEIRNIISDEVLVDQESAPDISILTEREMQVVEGVKQGQSSKEIALDLSISLKTVEVHRHHILRKLNLKNAAALVNFINRAEQAGRNFLTNPLLSSA